MKSAGRARKSPDVISDNLYAVVMAGGKGTRFWPLSRERYPKQYLKLTGKRTLMQETLHRVAGAVRPENVLVVTTQMQRDIVDWQAREVLGPVQTVVEPVGRNTAPAIALMAFKLAKRNKNAMLLVLPSDHYIKDKAPFIETLSVAMKAAAKGKIVTFGITPSRPETGYGYIKAGGRLPGLDGVFNVQSFVEKPNLKTAQGYIKQGNYFWNSGMFLFRATDMIAELKKHMPCTYKAFDAIRKHLGTKREEAALAEAYATVEEQSIDYGVMEKSSRVAVVKADFHWSDIGSWNALEEVLDADHEGNVSQGNVVALDSEDSVFFTDEKLVAAVGVKGLVVVNTSDAVMVVPKERVQQVKDLVGALKDANKQEYLAPMIEERPWGHFLVLEHGPSYKIKRIHIKPKQRLSLQMHNHRSEHWIVVSGTATVTRGDEVFYVHQNESTFIPATVRHRLENKGKIPLQIIEIQSGEYLGEDDIIRFDDVYGRKTR